MGIVTLSVLMLSGNLYSATGALGNISLDADEIFIRSGNPNDVVLRCKPGKTISMIAAKLELGSQQTLAHQDADGNWVLNEIPDYGEQLARCQRYFTKLKNVIMNGMTNSGGTMAFGAINLPVPMRAKPSVSSYSFNYGVAGGTKITSVSSASVYGGEIDQSMFYAQFGASGLPGDTNFAAYMTDLALTADL